MNWLPSYSYTPQSYRRPLIAGTYTAFTFAVALILFNQPWLTVAGYVLLVLASVGHLAILYSLDITQDPEDELDERQQESLVQAKSIAYQINLTILSLIVLSLTIINIFHWSVEWPPLQLWVGVLPCALTLTQGLPQAILAWTEPDEDDEQA